jgi:hypothetical protein
MVTVRIPEKEFEVEKIKINRINIDCSNENFIKIGAYNLL